MAVRSQEVLAYLAEGDLARAQLGALAGRCRQRAFFASATAALRTRHAWAPQLWCARPWCMLPSGAVCERAGPPSIGYTSVGCKINSSA